MTNVIEMKQPEPAPAQIRSITQIIADLSKPVAPRHLKQKEVDKRGTTVTYLPWYQCVRYLDPIARPRRWRRSRTRSATATRQQIVSQPH
jgi:hypothetical protein